MLKYETLLDLSRQRLDFIARSPNWTREAREQALDLKRQVEAELAFLNTHGSPARVLVQGIHTDEEPMASDLRKLQRAA